MKMFIVLFIIAASLPADAQRVRENIRQRTDIAGLSQPVEASAVKAKASKSNPSNNSSAQPKK